MRKELQYNRRRFLKTAAMAVAPATLPLSARQTLAKEGSMPELSGAIGWLNSAPLSAKGLHGKVVLVNFWTYTCINSLRPLPYLKSWAAKYKDAGLIVIGVHTPEFSFEKQTSNVENAVRDLKVAYPVAIDSKYAIWQAFNNEYWPAQYFIDGKGQIRTHHFGEGAYGKSERLLQDLLQDNGAVKLDRSIGRIFGAGVEAAPGPDVQSPETYVGYRRAERFASFERVAHHSPKIYKSPEILSLNQWGLSGAWNVGAESAVLLDAPGKIVFRFHSRDLHMVLGPAENGQPVRFRTMLDGAAPGDHAGVDSAPNGTGVVAEPRLYQLIRHQGLTKDRTFEIEFLDVGVHAFVFTFG